MWERTRRLSSSLASHHSYHELDGRSGDKGDEGLVLLDLDLDFKDKSARFDAASVVSVASTKSVEGYEVQRTVGGTLGNNASNTAMNNSVIMSAIAGNVGDGSDSEEDGEVEGQPLVLAVV